MDENDRDLSPNHTRIEITIDLQEQTTKIEKIKELGFQIRGKNKRDWEPRARRDLASWRFLDIVFVYQSAGALFFMNILQIPPWNS